MYYCKYRKINNIRIKKSGLKTYLQAIIGVNPRKGSPEQFFKCANSD
jgi:hypothetical protein